jgi:hypothetical protein
MSDTSGRRSMDTVVIPAALVFPGDPVPNMGPNTVRIPVRVVWREADPPAVGRSPRSLSDGTPNAGTVRNQVGHHRAANAAADWIPNTASFSQDASQFSLETATYTAYGKALVAAAMPPIQLAAAPNPEEEAVGISEGGAISCGGGGAIGGPISGGREVGWGGFSVGHAAVYDESDEIMLPPNERSAAWNERGAPN